MYILFIYGNSFKSKRLRDIKYYLATYHGLNLSRDLETPLASIWVEKQDGRSCKDIPFLN